MKISCLTFFASLFLTSSICSAQSLPMFVKGKIDYIFESTLVINGQEINRDGKALVPMGATQKGSVCFQDLTTLVNHSFAGFLAGTNDIKNKTQCTFSNLKVTGNVATFKMVCNSGSPAIPNTNGDVTHTYTPAKNEIIQKFVGSNLYGKKIESTNVYRRIGGC